MLKGSRKAPTKLMEETYIKHIVMKCKITRDKGPASLKREKKQNKKKSGITVASDFLIAKLRKETMEQ